jgi:hypothetical protein
VPQHHLDRRVHLAEAEGQDWYVAMNEGAPWNWTCARR